jgi:SAM-dependent methyltransferase
MLRFCKRDIAYDEYKKIQIERSQAKWTSSSFNESIFMKVMLTALPLMVKQGTIKLLRPDDVLCLGIRNGNEYFAFGRLRKIVAQLMNTKVWGVDINPRVVHVGPDCYEADFNHLPLDWQGKFDLLYSNSLDHSFDLKETLSEWWRVARKDSYLVLTLPHKGKTCETDLYDFTEDDADELVSDGKWWVIHKWIEYGQEGSFNVLLGIIK